MSPMQENWFFPAIALRRSVMMPPMTLARSTRPSSAITSSTASAAAQDIGCPP